MRNFIFLVSPSSVERLVASGEMKVEVAFTPEETDVWDDDTPEVSVSHARWRLGHVMQPRNPETWASVQLPEQHGSEQSAGENGGFVPGDGQHSVRQLGRDWSGEVELIDRVKPAPASTSEIRPKQYFLDFSVSVHCATNAVK